MRNAVLLLIGLAAPLMTQAEELTDAQRQGKALFDQSCTFCHGERGHATTLLRKRLGDEHALLETRTSLSVDLIRHVVRNGINSMPVYRRAELSEHELDLIAAYLTRPR
jgi:mono/diheme cytochrome c family protein